MSLFSASKCILVMSDDGLQLYTANKFGVRFIDSIPWETDQFPVTVSNLIVKKGKRRPILILNDMVEQHYRKERIPNVSVLDKANVIQRRLNVSFPNHKVRSALKLRGKTADDKSAGGSPYLFAAIPTSTAYKLTIQSVEMAATPVEGLYLLPVEASSMVSVLSSRLAKKDRQHTTWTIFAGQHHNGGLRQIVIRDGELALTRMTPIVDTDVEPELWAKEVSNELTATMSYLARFGYKETDGLRIIVIASDAAAHSIEIANSNSEVDIMTAAKAASHVGVRLGKQKEPRYADPVHIAYLSKLKRFLLPMKSPALTRLSTPRKVASIVLMALLVGCGYFGFLSVQAFNEAISLSDRLRVSIQQRQTLEQEYKRELEVKKSLGFDFALVTGSLDTFQEMQNQKTKPLPVIREIGRSLGTDIHLDNLLMNLEEVVILDPENPNEIYEDRERKYFTNIVLSLSFPSEIDPDLGVQRINNLKSRLQDNLPAKYSVEITRQIADLSYTGNFVGGEEDATPEDYIAEILIRGAIQ